MGWTRNIFTLWSWPWPLTQVSTQCVVLHDHDIITKFEISETIWPSVRVHFVPEPYDAWWSRPFMWKGLLTLHFFLVANSKQSVAVLTTWCQVSLSFAFLHAMWTPKFCDCRSSPIVLSQVLGRPAGLLQSAGGRSAAAMTLHCLCTTCTLQDYSWTFYVSVTGHE